MSTVPSFLIVVADDDSEDHQLITEAIKECGKNYLITSVFNGHQLLDLLLQQGIYSTEISKIPDAVILDLRMPIMDGFATLEKIRTFRQFDNLPIFVLTEFGHRRDVERTMKLGAEAYFTKPLRFDELQKLITEICKRIELGKT